MRQSDLTLDNEGEIDIHVSQVNKGGSQERQEHVLAAIKSLQDAKNQMTAFNNPIVYESELPLQILYN